MGAATRPPSHRPSEKALPHDRSVRHRSEVPAPKAEFSRRAALPISSCPTVSHESLRHGWLVSVAARSLQVSRTFLNVSIFPRRT